ncbi:hypothetical protein M9435_004201 [Picochlorum sp. BPE23]|nr:hypothetical protein M9435_004201 [Picochlorum sp. BPE23]
MDTTTLVETIRGPDGGVNKLFIFKRHTPRVDPSQANTNIVVYFVGDDVGHFHGCHPDIIRLGTDDAYIAEHVLAKAFPTAKTIVIIHPCRYEAGFACYDNFIEYDTWDVAGDHIKYHGKGLRSSTQRHWVYTSRTNKACRHLYGLVKGYIDKDILWTLVGFSKGGMVVNQILTELSSLAQSCSASEHEDWVRFMKNLKQVHYVDVGLNCPGAYIWDDNVIKGMALHWNRMHLDQSQLLVLHGTRRQFQVHGVEHLEEMRTMVALCRKHGIPCHVNLYNMKSEAIDPVLRTDPMYTFVTTSQDAERAGHSSQELLLEHLRCLRYMAKAEYK